MEQLYVFNTEQTFPRPVASWSAGCTSFASHSLSQSCAIHPNKSVSFQFSCSSLVLVFLLLLLPLLLLLLLFLFTPNLSCFHLQRILRDTPVNFKWPHSHWYHSHNQSQRVTWMRMWRWREESRGTCPTSGAQQFPGTSLTLSGEVPVLLLLLLFLWLFSSDSQVGDYFQYLPIIWFWAATIGNFRRCGGIRKCNQKSSSWRSSFSIVLVLLFLSPQWTSRETCARFIVTLHFRPRWRTIFGFFFLVFVLQSPKNSFPPRKEEECHCCGWRGEGGGEVWGGSASYKSIRWDGTKSSPVDHGPRVSGADPFLCQHQQRPASKQTNGWGGVGSTRFDAEFTSSFDDGDEDDEDDDVPLLVTRW